MYADAIDAMGEQAAAKIAAQRLSLPAHLIRSMLAGMYVGAAIVLIFTIGGALSKDFPALVKPVMGACFGGALTIVIFAGSELFTGSNLVLTVGVLSGKASGRDLAAAIRNSGFVSATQLASRNAQQNGRIHIGDHR